MKPTLLIIFFAIFPISSLFLVDKLHASSTSASARIEQTQGFVYKKSTQQSASYDMISQREPLNVGDSLRTTKRALTLVRAPGGHRFKLAPETEIELKELPTTAKPQLNLHLHKGQLYTYTIGDPEWDDSHMGIVIEIGPHRVEAHNGKIFLAAAGQKGSQEAILISHSARGEIINQGGDRYQFQSGRAFVITKDDIAPLGRQYHEEFTKNMNWSFEGKLKVEAHEIEL